MVFDLRQFCAGRVVLMDGSWGTELQKRNQEPGAFAEILNLEQPAAVKAVARKYAEAGAEVILTNTFRGNRLALKDAGLADQTGEINEAAARLSKEGAGEAGSNAKIVGSIGPSGLIVFGNDDAQQEILKAFAEQALALARGGVDAIVIETMIELDELLLGIRAVKENTSLPVIASMTYDAGTKLGRTAFGVTVEQHVEAATAAGADVVGANCGTGVDQYVSIAKELCAAATCPVWIRANAGLPTIVNGVATYQQDPETYARHAVDIIQAGVNFIGGCCGTTPDHIRALADVITKTHKA